MTRNGGVELIKRKSGDSCHRTVESLVVDREVHPTNLHLVFFDWLMSCEEMDKELATIGFRRARIDEIPKTVSFDQYSGGSNWSICLRVVVVKI